MPRVQGLRIRSFDGDGCLINGRWVYPRDGLVRAPMEGEKYSNKHRCGGRCVLPDEECPICEQYVCWRCGMTKPWANGGTDGTECDECWSDKQKRREDDNRDGVLPPGNDDAVGTDLDRGAGR